MDQQTQKGGNCLPEKKKMEALGRLSCRVAHDFNNILGAIEGYATLAMNGVKADDPLAQDLREIRIAVAKAAFLGKQLIASGGRQMLHKAPCGVNDIIAATLKRAELAQDGNFKIEARLEPGLPGVIADAALVEQALANLLLNAREAMTGGGTAVVSSSSVRLEGDAVNSPKPPEAGSLFVKITVRDSGAGISAEVLECLFEPLFSAGKKGLGVGLGLSTVYGVVKQHNGWVEAKSVPGQGSEFAVFLPASTAAEPG
ncbi:MAG: ATP-binding protein [Elusimicrobiota bacterium]|nr:ATP-binding protein [Elusimicrobiota bacterium]